MSGAPDSAILADTDALAAALVERALPVRIRQALGPADVAAAQRLRGAAILERGWSQPETLIDGRDVDPDDHRAVHILAFRGDRAVGTCRLLYPEGASAPTEPVFLGRITVDDPEDRARHSVAGALIGRSWLDIRARGYSRIAGLTSAPMLRLLRRMGFNVRVVGPPVRNFGEDRVPIVFGPGEATFGTVAAMSPSVLADAFAHHTWATLRLIDACGELGAEQLATTVPGTYGSIIDTIRHVVGADAGYLNLLTQGGTLPISPIDEEAMDVDQARAATVRHGEAWASLARGDFDPDAIVVRHRDDGSESHAPLGLRLAQAIHHGTDHRSQVCTALTTLGVEPPEIDVWAFAAQNGRVVVVSPRT